MNNKTPFQEFIDHQKEIGNPVKKLAKLWGVMHQTVYNAYNSGYVKDAKLLKTICRKSGGNPRVLMGLPVNTACPYCHHGIDGSKLVYHDKVKPELSKHEKMANDYDNTAAYFGGYDGGGE